ncbi:MAG TPA: polyprenol phosphomannose-dependent alpha 1,6 mannosyltransferase MptB, partial [Actinomycetota bacterium]
LVRAGAMAGVVSGTVVGVVSWATGLGYGWIGALNTPGTVRNWLSGTTLLGEAVGLLTNVVGLGDDQTTTEAIKVFRGAGGLIALVICLLLLARMERYGLVGSLGLGFIAVVALGPVVHPWYLLWGFVLVAAGIPTLRIRSAVLTASAALSMVLMPKGGTVDVSAIVQAIMSAAAVAGSAALFELLPGPATRPLPLASAPAPAARVPTRPRT